MLSMQSRYALKALQYMAKKDQAPPIPTGQISRETGVPRKFLEATLAQLKRHSIVVSRMGKAGGYALAKPADKISFAMVIRAIDGPIALLPCASKHFYKKCEMCEDEETCSVRAVMIAARDKILAVLEHQTIADTDRPA